MKQIEKVINSTIQEVSQDILEQIEEDAEIVADEQSFIENFYDIVEDSLDYDAIIQCVLRKIRNVVLSHK